MCCTSLGPSVAADGQLTGIALPPRLPPRPCLISSQQEDAKVELNWENIDSSWVPPAGVRQLKAVPLLAETLERLLLEDDSGGGRQPRKADSAATLVLCIWPAA